MLRKQVYQYILKLMLDHPYLLRYYPQDGRVWITDGFIGFCMDDTNQVFDLDKMTLMEELPRLLGDAPERRENYLLHDTKRLKITGQYLVHIYERAGKETWLNDSLIGKFFPDREYEYFQAGSKQPVFIYPIDYSECIGFVFPIAQTEDKHD